MKKLFIVMLALGALSCKKEKVQDSTTPHVNTAPIELAGEWVRDSLGNASVMFANPNTETVMLNFSSDTLYKKIVYTSNSQVLPFTSTYTYSGNYLTWLTYKYDVSLYSGKLRLTLNENNQVMIETFKRK